jgi:hypothetical protein
MVRPQPRPRPRRSLRGRAVPLYSYSRLVFVLRGGPPAERTALRATQQREAEAVRRMRDAIGVAATLLRDPALSVEDGRRLSQAIEAARWALDHYEELRS